MTSNIRAEMKTSFKHEGLFEYKIIRSVTTVEKSFVYDHQDPSGYEHEETKTSEEVLCEGVGNMDIVGKQLDCYKDLFGEV